MLDDTAWHTPVGNSLVYKLLFDMLVLAFQDGLNSYLSTKLAYILLGLGILKIFVQALNPLANFFSAELGRRLTVNIQAEIYTKVNSIIGIGYHEQPQFHDTLRLAEQGAQSGAHQSFQTVTHLGESLITLLGFVGALIVFSPLLAILVALSTIPQLFVERKITRQRFNLAKDLSPHERRIHYYRNLLSSEQPAREVRLWGLGSYFLDNLLDLCQRIHGAQRDHELYELRWVLFLEFLATAIATAAFVGVVLQAVAGGFSLGDVTLYNSAVSGVQGSLSRVFYALSALNEYVLFFSAHKELKTLPQPVRLCLTPCPVPKLTDGIEFRNVSFRYPHTQRWVLKEVNLFIPAGKCLALLGLNGAGKTTIVNLLTRLHDPLDGEILWDGISISEFDPQELRRQIAVVFQNFTRYEFTVKENIALGDLNSVEDMWRIHRAAEKAGVHQLIQALPHGYDTMLSRVFQNEYQGIDLSGGEWQKIAIARTFMRDGNLLILDEPTAALDAQAEHEVYERFRKLVEQRTSILISHRFSTLRAADLIAVLENGNITEQGTHNQLIANRGIYYRLYNLQVESFR